MRREGVRTFTSIEAREMMDLRRIRSSTVVAVAEWVRSEGGEVGDALGAKVMQA